MRLFLRDELLLTPTAGSLLSQGSIDGVNQLGGTWVVAVKVIDHLPSESKAFCVNSERPECPLYYSLLKLST